MTDRELVAAMMSKIEDGDGHGFTTWEITFCARMSETVGYGRLLSPAQRCKLDQIYRERVRGEREPR